MWELLSPICNFACTSIFLVIYDLSLQFLVFFLSQFHIVNHDVVIGSKIVELLLM